MAKTSVAAALIAQVDFNMALMRTLLELMETIPGANENQRVVQSLRELSEKNAEVLEHAGVVISDSNPRASDGS